jgi:Ca2+-binding RTX toxin-like protein
MDTNSLAVKLLEPSFHQDLNGDGRINVVTVIETAGLTRLTRIDNNFYLYDGSGNGPSLKFSGADYDVAQLNGWVPLGAEQIAGGYEVAWKNPATDQAVIWNVDLSGNYISHTLMARSSATLQSLETGFQQDLNGDGTLVVETDGSTGFSAVNNHFVLGSGGSALSLKFFGADYDAGLLNGWVPVGAEQIGGGYEVAWKNPATGQFSIWNTDSSGNYISYTALDGSSLALKLMENSFHQDLNGDGRIGPVATVIETAGAIHLTKVDNNFGLFDSNGSGPSLKYNGAEYDAAQAGPFVAVGAEQVAGGYVMAWKNPGTGLFSIWNPDIYGNSTSYTPLDGNSGTLQSLETSFHQDLNGDGMIGTANVLIGDGNANHLTGTAGNDTFVFNTALNASNVDTITDFDVAHDTIRLDKSVFTALAHPGVLDAGAYFAGSAAHDADDRIIYNAGTGALSYDADGSAGGAAVQFAILAANFNLTNAHFTVA